jgi:hypothetical protein
MKGGLEAGGVGTALQVHQSLSREDAKRTEPVTRLATPAAQGGGAREAHFPKRAHTYRDTHLSPLR